MASLQGLQVSVHVQWELVLLMSVALMSGRIGCGVGVQFTTAASSSIFWAQLVQILYTRSKSSL